MDAECEGSQNTILFKSKREVHPNLDRHTSPNFMLFDPAVKTTDPYVLTLSRFVVAIAMRSSRMRTCWSCRTMSEESDASTSHLPTRAGDLADHVAIHGTQMLTAPRSVSRQARVFESEMREETEQLPASRTVKSATRP